MKCTAAPYVVAKIILNNNRLPQRALLNAHFTATIILVILTATESGEISELPLSRFAQISRLALEMTMAAADEREKPTWKRDFVWGISPCVRLHLVEMTGIVIV